MYKVFFYLIAPFFFVFTSLSRSYAQESDFHARFFQNRYITNPAMAGTSAGADFNVGYQQPFNTVPGSLKAQYLTAEYGANNNVGIGLNVYNESVGLIKSTRIMGTYAYHLQVSEKSRLNFGLSLGVNNTHIDYSEIVGNQGDLSVNRYNAQPLYVDGDFGTSFTSEGLNIQAVLPNLKSLFFKGDGQNQQIDQSFFISTISYRIVNDGSNYVLEPLADFKLIRSATGIASGGLNFELPEYKINLSGMYHSNQSGTVSLGLGIDNFALFVAYSSDLSSLKKTESNLFEIGLRLRLLKKPEF